MKNFPVAAGFVGALLLASVASAEDITIKWQQQGLPIGTGWLPKIASDGQIGMTTLIFQTGTGNAAFEYSNGFLNTSSKLLSWIGPYNVFSSTEPSPEVGHEPSIALVTCGVYACLSSGHDVANVIQVHQGGQDSGAALWYRTGVYDPGSPTVWAAAIKYDDGYNPTVAADPGGSSFSTTTVVEVHQGGVDSSDLWYHVGTLTYGESTVYVTWGPSYRTGFSGYAPTVAIYGGLVVLVAQGTKPQLWYSLGVVDTSTNTINWGDAKNYDTGFNPTVSLRTCGPLFSCGWIVTEAHQGGGGTGPLWYRIGTLNSSGGSYPTSITWTPNSATKYNSSGCYPSISVLSNSLGYSYDVVESHSEACGGPAKIVASWGTLN